MFQKIHLSDHRSITISSSFLNITPLWLSTSSSQYFCKMYLLFTLLSNMDSIFIGNFIGPSSLYYKYLGNYTGILQVISFMLFYKLYS